MTIRVDRHSHIILADLPEMVAAAKRVQVKEYAVTEHVSQFADLRKSVKFGSVHNSGRMFTNLKEYREEFEKISEDTEITVRTGLEVDFSPRFEKAVGDFVNQAEWDLLLCSVHEFDNGKDVETGAGERLDQATVDKRWREYFKLQQLALKSHFVPFSVLAHPVRMSRGLAATPTDIDRLLLELSSTARGRNKALEINGSDIRYSLSLVRSLAKACSTVQCSVSLGSDAHHPNEVFRNMDVAMGLVDEFHLRTI